MKTIEPAADYAFIQREEVGKSGEVVSKSGIFIPSASVEQLNVGTVINVGPNVPYSQGDEILYKPYGLIDVKVNDKPYCLVNKEDIIGKYVDVIEDSL